jgi:hypothetical protein
MLKAKVILSPPCAGNQSSAVGKLEFSTKDTELRMKFD